jgi:hypothetical protein
MMARLIAAAAVAVVLLAPGTARAQEQGIAGRFTIAAQVGTESQLGGQFLQGAEGTLLGKPITIDSKSYKDVYAPALRLQALVGYGVGRRTELIVRGTYYKADATALEVGTSNDNAVFAYFGPYEEWGVELGVRYYLSTRGRFQSYVAPIGGVRFLDHILVDFSIPAAGSAVLNVPFQKSGTVGVFGLDLGFNFDLWKAVFLGVDTGLRYQTKPPAYDGLPTLERINQSDGRWSAPVVLSLGVKF